MHRLPDRFVRKVQIDPISGCWNWTGAASRGSSGGKYGGFYFNGKRRKAHRFAYERIVGSISAGLEIDHTCENTLCVNPGHLEPVTKAENMERSGLSDVYRQRREKPECKRGHALKGSLPVA